MPLVAPARPNTSTVPVPLITPPKVCVTPAAVFEISAPLPAVTMSLLNAPPFVSRTSSVVPLLTFTWLAAPPTLLPICAPAVAPSPTCSVPPLIVVVLL